MSAYKNRQSKTYQAEWDTFTSKSINAPYGLSAAKRLIREYLPEWQVSRGKQPDTALCYVYEKRIELGKSSPIWIVCHEIAHGLVEERHLPIGHHEVFRQYYIDVCTNSMSPYWGSKLSRNFDSARLEYCYPGQQQTVLDKIKNFFS